MSPSPSRSPLPHIPALDGLRALALLGVLFFHASGALPGGYLGVDLFFVLSGFLITSLLLAEHQTTGGIDLRAFLGRRARRLLPALLALMPAIALYGRLVAKPDELAGLRGDALATLGYVANWHTIYAQKSYWELFAAPSPLDHTWSLAIEEQFYLVWPAVVALLLWRRSRRSVLAVALVLASFSMIAMVVLFDPSRTSRVYLGTDTRAAGLLFGAALAALVTPGTVFTSRTVRALDGAGVLAAAGLGVSWWRLGGENPFLYHGGLWLTEAAALILILCAVAGPRSLVARALSFRPLTLLGTISYGVYLWHWPVNVVLSADRLQVGRWIHVVQFATTFAIAIVSYLLIERPIRRRGLPVRRPAYAVLAAVLTTGVLVVRATKARAESPTASSLGTSAGAVPAGMEKDSTLDPQFKILLLGDSTANSLGWGIRGLREPGVAVDLQGKDGCTMLADLCNGPTWNQSVKDTHPNATIVHVGGAFMHGITVKGEWEMACRRDWDNRFEHTLAQRLGDAKNADSHVWAMTVPQPLGPWDTRPIHAQVDCINVAIRKAVKSVPGVEVLDLAEHLCPKGECVRESDGAVVRPDGVHFSIEGAAEVSRWVLDRVRSGADHSG